MASNNKVEVHIGANTSALKTGMKESGEIVNKSAKEIEAIGKGTRFTVDLSGLEKTFAQTSKNIQSNMQTMNTNITNSFNQSFASVSSSLKSLTGLFAGLVTIDSVTSMADGYVQMGAQIRSASTSAAEYNDVQKHLLETANTTYRSLQEAQQVYLDVGGALKAFGTSTEEALRITDSLSFSFTHNATASDKAKNATDAFTKSIYNNKATGDQFTTMLSAVPSIVGDLSASMGKSKAEILEMGNAGKITGDQLKKAFNESREANEDLANKMENSVKDGLTVLKTELGVYIGKANEAHAITGKISAVFVALAKNIGTLVAGVSSIAAVLAVKYITQMALSIRVTIAATIENIRHQASLAAISVQATATTRSMVVLRGAMAVLGGPAGLAMLAVQGVAAGAAFLYMKKSSDEVEPSLDSQGKTVAELKAEYDRLDAAQQRVITRQAKADLTKAEEGFRKQELALLGLVRAVISHSDASYEDTQKAKDLYDQYQKGKITADQLATGINNLKTVEDKHKVSIDENSKSLTKEKEAVFSAESILKTYNNTTRQSTTDNAAHTKSIDDKAAAYANLTDKQREYVLGVDKATEREIYIQTNMKARGISREQAEHEADARDTAGMGFTNKDGKMPKDVFDRTQASWNLKQQKKSREEAERKSNAESKKSENSKYQATSYSDLRVKSKEAYAGGKAHQGVLDLAGLIQDKFKITRFTAFNDKYHQGTNSKHAKGLALDFGLQDPKNSANVASELRGMLQKNNVKGQVLDEYKNPSARATGGHIHVSFNSQADADRYLGLAKSEGVKTKSSGQSSSDNQYKQYLDKEVAKAEEAEKQKVTLQYKYASEKKQIELDLKQDLEDINKSTLSSEDKHAFTIKAEKDAADKIKAIRIEELEQSKALLDEELKGKELLAQRTYELEMAQIKASFDAKNISNGQRIVLEKQLEDKLYAIKRNGLIERLSLEQELGSLSGKSGNTGNTNEEIANLDNQKTISDTQMPGLINDAQMKDFEDKFGGLTDRISGLWDKGIQSMMNGTLTWRDATNAVLTDMGAYFIQSMVTQPLREYLTGLARRMAVKLGFVKAETAAEVTGQAAQTTAVVAGETTKTAATGMGVLARLGLKAGEAIKSIMMYAWEAMAGAFKAMVSIPYIGPVLAVAAGASALALVGGLAGKIKSARGGYDIPSGVNPMTQLHEEEMVLPKQHANTIRALGRSMSGGSGVEQSSMGGDGGMTSININAWDSKDIKRFMKKHGRELAGGLKGYNRNFGR